MLRTLPVLVLAGALTARMIVPAATSSAQPVSPIVITVPDARLAACRQKLSSVLPIVADSRQGADGQVRPVARPPARALRAGLTAATRALDRRTRRGISCRRPQEGVRTMPCVSDLPIDLQERLGARDLIVFDAECVLCSGFFHFVLRHDHAGRFAFVTAQSSLGTTLYHALDLPTDAYETNLVLVGGRIHRHAGAFAAAMGALGWPWRLAACVGWLPGWLTRPAYLAVARNRYRLFGRHDTCLVPTPEVRDRFLAGGWT